MQQADVYVGKTIYQAVIRKLLSSCCNCCFKKKPTEQPDPRLNWTIIDVEARFVLLYYHIISITFPHLIIIFQLTMIYVIILTDPQQSNKVDFHPNPPFSSTFNHFRPFSSTFEPCSPTFNHFIHFQLFPSTFLHFQPFTPTFI